MSIYNFLTKPTSNSGLLTPKTPEKLYIFYLLSFLTKISRVYERHPKIGEKWIFFINFKSSRTWKLDRLVEKKILYQKMKSVFGCMGINKKCLGGVLNLRGKPCKYLMKEYFFWPKGLVFMKEQVLIMLETFIFWKKISNKWKKQPGVCFKKKEGCRF